MGGICLSKSLVAVPSNSELEVTLDLSLCMFFFCFLICLKFSTASENTHVTKKECPEHEPDLDDLDIDSFL